MNMNISKFNKCTKLILSQQQQQQHIRTFSSSFNFKNFSKYRNQRKQFEQDFQKQKEQIHYEKERKRYDRTSQQQENQFKEQHEEIHFQGQSHTPIKIPIFKIFFKLLSQILVSVIKRKLFSTTTEYKELYEFTANVLNENKSVIQSAIQSPIPIAIGKPKILNTSFIPKHSQFSNQDDQIMMVLELDTPQSVQQQSSISLNVVTLAKSLPDRLVQSSFPWNLFGNGSTVQKVADPIRVTLLVDIEQIDPFGFIVSEKKEIPLFNAVEQSSSGNPFSDFSQEYDIFENHQQQNHYDKQEQQHRRSNKNQSTTNNHETIELDKNDYREVYNNNNNNKKK